MLTKNIVCSQLESLLDILIMLVTMKIRNYWVRWLFMLTELQSFTLC